MGLASLYGRLITKDVLKKPVSLTQDQIHLAKQLFADGMRKSDIATQFESKYNVHRTTIYRHLTNKRYDKRSRKEDLRECEICGEVREHHNRCKYCDIFIHDFNCDDSVTRHNTDNRHTDNICKTCKQRYE